MTRAQLARCYIFQRCTAMRPTERVHLRNIDMLAVSIRACAALSGILI